MPPKAATATQDPEEELSPLQEAIRRRQEGIRGGRPAGPPATGQPPSPLQEAILRRRTGFGSPPQAVRPTESPLGRGVRRNLVAGLEKGLDFIARSEYASASAFRTLLRETPEEAAEAATQGLLGKSKISYLDIAAEDFGLSTEPFFTIPNFRPVPDFVEHIARGVLTPAGVTGFALGMVLDPLSWVGVGLLTKSGRLAELRRAATIAKKPFPQVGKAGKLVYPQGSVIEEGSKLARELEAHFARTGEIPAELADAVALQSRAGHRALLQVTAPVIPFTPLRGQLIAKIPGIGGGRPVFEAATALRNLITHRAPQVNRVLGYFSNFGIPAWTIDNFARASADENVRGFRAARRLEQVAKELKVGEGGWKDRMRTMTEAVESVEPITQERFELITRSVPIESRVLGTLRFAENAIDEATGKTVLQADALELQMLRERLGLQPNQRLARVEVLGQEAVHTPKFPLSFEYGAGETGRGLFARNLESLQEDASFLALEFFPRPGQADAFVPTHFSGEGVNRVLIDLDFSGRAEAIDAQIREIVARIPKMTTAERAEAAKILDGLTGARQRALGDAPARHRPWRASLIRRNAATGASETVNVLHAPTLQEVYNEILGPMTTGMERQVAGQIAFLDDQMIEQAKRMARRQNRYQKLMSARARDAARFDDSVKVRERIVKQERKEEFDALEQFMQTVREYGKIPDLMGDEWKRLDTAYLEYAGKAGRPAESILRQLGPEDQIRTGRAGEDIGALRQRILGELAERLEIEPDGLSSATEMMAYFVRDFTERARLWTKESPWLEAKNQLVNEMDPSWMRLERADRLLVKLGLKEDVRKGSLRGKLAEQARRRQTRELARGAAVEIPEHRAIETKTIGPSGFTKEVLPKAAAEIEEMKVWQEVLPRFSNLPDDIRRAAVAMEAFYAEYARQLIPRGGIQGIIPGYIHHARYDSIDRLKKIAAFTRIAKNTPIEIRKPGFGRHRTIQEGIHEINDRLNREFFLTDVLSASALYAKEANRFIATHDFVNRTLNRLLEDGAAYTVDARRVNVAQLDPRMGLYFPRGRMSFFPTKTIPYSRISKESRDFIQHGGVPKDGKVLIEIKPGDIRTMIGVTTSVPAIVMPKEIADFLNRANALYQRPEGLSAIRDLILGVRNVWVRWTLFPFAGYHIRNAVGNVLNNLFRGLTDPLRYEQAYLVQTGKDFALQSIAGAPMTANMIRNEAMQHGVVGAGFWTGIAGPASALDDQIRKGFGSKTGWRAALDKYGPSGFIQAAMSVAEKVENNARLALYIERRMLGDTPELASRMVRETLFDSTSAVPFDRFTRSYIAPFWNWTRNNIPFQVKMLLQHPTHFASIERINRLIQASSDPAVEVLPQWMHEGLPVRLFETPDKRGEFRYFILRNWLPPADLQVLFGDPLHSAMSMLAPWLRVPIERKANYSFYFRRPIETIGGQYGRFLRMDMRRRDIEILRSVAVLAAVDNILGPGDNFRQDHYLEPNVWSRVLASRVGIGKLYRVDLLREQEIARNQQERLIRELKIARKRAQRAGDQATMRHLSERIRQEEARVPTYVRALPLAIPPAEF